MPRTQVDYSKTVIYKIQHIEDESLLYVGSTTNFTKRKSQHKTNCTSTNSKEYNQKKYRMMRENGGWDMFQMIEIEKFQCNDKREAEKRENEIMKELKANMNSLKSHSGFETIKDYKKHWLTTTISKQYILNNKEVRNAKKRENVKCECGLEMTRNSLARHKKTKKHIQLMEEKK